MVKLSKRRQVACAEYTSNSFNWFQAMVTAGFSEKYARHQGYKLLDNVDIQQEIDRLLADRQRKTGFNREKSEQMLQSAYDLALEQHNSQAMTSACRELNALYGLRQEFKQQVQGLVVNISEEKPEEATEQPAEPAGGQQEGTDAKQGGKMRRFVYSPEARRKGEPVAGPGELRGSLPAKDEKCI